MFRRQPKVTISVRTSTSGRCSGEHRGVELSAKLELDRARHQDVVILLAPLDEEIATGKRDANLAVGLLQARGSDRGGAGGGAASARQSCTALPCADDQMIARADLADGDVRALGKDRMILQERPEALEIVGTHVIDPEDRM